MWRAILESVPVQLLARGFDALRALSDERKACQCTHPQGWHFRGAGSCLECSCLAYRRGRVRAS
jgi:hypothetical protein